MAFVTGLVDLTFLLGASSYRYTHSHIRIEEESYVEIFQYFGHGSHLARRD
jgi:hypothetical protein